MRGFIIGGHSFNNIRYTDDIAIMTNSKNKEKERLYKVVELSKKK